MGTAIVRRIGAGKKILLGDISEEAFARKAAELGPVIRFITGTDLLIDGGVVASIRTSEYKLG